MQSEWNTLLEKIKAKDTQASSWKSDQESLEKIINWAIEAGIDDTGVSSIDNTKLRAIIKEVRKAINWGQPERVVTLFNWAKNDTVIVLRQKVGISTPEDIKVNQRKDGDETWLVIEFTPEQYERMVTDTKAHFQFVLPEESKFRKIL